MAHGQPKNLPEGFVITESWDYGDVPDDIRPTYVLRQFQEVTVGHLWWKRTGPRLVEVMREPNIDVLVAGAKFIQEREELDLGRQGTT